MLSINGKASHLYTTLLHSGPHRKNGGKDEAACAALAYVAGADPHLIGWRILRSG